jgi:uncharacterized membrane protein
MLVLWVLLVSMGLFRAAGALGVAGLDSWVAATRWALGVMLLFTASAHFTSMKEDLVRMMPPWVKNPRRMVLFTGICEILGAIGLQIPSVRRAAAVALIFFFIAVFPANVRAARQKTSIGKRPATPLWLRAPMQLLFIGLTAWAGFA